MNGFAFRLDLLLHAPTLALQPKSDVSDFGQLIERPNSGEPEFGCKRGREGTEYAALMWRYGLIGTSGR